MSQDLTFSQTVNKLFFGIDFADTSISLFDKLLSVPQLQHYDNGARQWNLNVSMEMKSEKAWSSRHVFTFIQSPLSDLKIEKGTIEIRLGETDSAKKILDLNWRIDFTDKTGAAKYFEKLKQLFGDLATKKKFEKDKDVGDIAQFSTRNPLDTGVRDITLFLSKPPMTKKHQVSLVFGTEFMDE
jgi:hypothetical protein